MAISYGRTDIETPIHADIKETISHGIIVSNLAYLVGKELGLQEEVCYDLAVAGMLHDLGKVRLNFYMNEKVEDEILAVDETRYMRMHPSIGYAILAEIHLLKLDSDDDLIEEFKREQTNNLTCGEFEALFKNR